MLKIFFDSAESSVTKEFSRPSDIPCAVLINSFKEDGNSTFFNKIKN